MKEVLIMDRFQKGFTLVELLIVIVIISILAAIAIPQFLGSTQDANEATLKADLTALRNAIELYYHQHTDQTGGLGSKFPGGSAATTTAAETEFLEHLTMYSTAAGTTSTTLDRATYPYGPYLKTAMPDNPLKDAATSAANANAIEVVDDGTTLSGQATASATKGWKYDVISGQFIANNEDYDEY